MNDGLWVEAILVLTVILDLLLLGSSRLRTCIRLTALQGIAVGALPILAGETGHMGRAWALAAASIGIKGFAFPWLLNRVLRESGARREVEPFVGYTLSVLIGVAALAFSLWLGSRLPLGEKGSLMVPAGLATLLVGLFLLISRRKAVSQALGYIVMENGVTVIGVAVVGGVPMLVELGVLLDAFVAVFIMGIAAYHISREFDHINVDRLSALKG
jgi:hydrogenase-4 component E